MAMIGEGICVVKTLTRNHLYCEPPSEQPAPRHRTKREGTDLLPEFTVWNQQYLKKSCWVLKDKQEVMEAGSGMGSGGKAEAWWGIGEVLGVTRSCSCSQFYSYKPSTALWLCISLLTELTSWHILSHRYRWET